MNKGALFDKIESEQFRKEPAKFNVGDSVRVLSGSEPQE